MPDLTHRIDKLELMDNMEYSPETTRATLRFLERANHYFGGYHVIFEYLDRWARRWPANKTITFLDVGTGGGDIPRLIARWARLYKKTVEITAIDLMDTNIQIARQALRNYPEVQVRRQDLFHYDKNQRFDYVLASLFLHHVPIGKEIETLLTFDRLAARGVIVSDLIRSQGAYWSTKLATALMGNAINRHDGPLSVQRAFRPNELRAFVRAIQRPYLKVRRHAWFRLAVAGEKVVS